MDAEKSKPLTFVKLPSNEVGINAPSRRCTDCPCLLLFVIVWALMGYVAYIAFHHGNLDRIEYGVDYLGNICGHGVPMNVTADTVTNWANLTSLWYPVTFNTNTKSFNVRSALKLGVCVSQCPSDYDFVPLYGSNDPPSLPLQWLSLFNSSLKFNRCIPQLFQYRCVNNSDNTGDDCTLAMGPGNAEIRDELGLVNIAYTGFAELRRNWWIILSCFAIALGICFLWLFALRRLVKPIVVLTMILLVIGLAGIGYFLFYQAQEIKQVAGAGTDSYKWYFYGSLAVWLLDFIVICVILFIFRDVMIAADIIEEASKIPLAIPTMLLVPVVSVIFIIGFVCFAIFTSAFIYTSGDSVPVSVVVPNQVAFNSNTTAELREVQFSGWRGYAHAYNLFVFLWSVALVGAVDFMILAFCSIFWYWTADKTPDHGVFAALSLTIKHIGSLCFGSLLIAIIQFVRIMMQLIEHRLQTLAKSSTAVKLCIGCAQCCLACFECCVKFMNKNAYIVQTMTGESFVPAAKHALSLLCAHALSVGAVSVIGEFVMFFGKLFITAAVTASAYGIMTGTSKGREATNDSTSGIVLMLITVAIMAYIVAAIFINVFHVCIDSVLLSYCYDLEQNNGADRQYFCPPDLAQHIERAKQRKPPGEGSTPAVTDASKPLNSS